MDRLRLGALLPERAEVRVALILCLSGCAVQAGAEADAGPEVADGGQAFDVALPMDRGAPDAAPALDGRASDVPSLDGAPPDDARPDGAQPDGLLPDGGAPDGPRPDVPEPDRGLPDAGPPELVVVHLAPDGDDESDGAAPFATLAGVHAWLEERAPEGDVEVRVRAGRYHGQTVSWTWTRPDRRIRFVRDADEGRPVFDGCLEDGACPGGTWFTLRSASGNPTNLHFEYLRVENYQTAISFNGDRNDPAASNGRNRIYGCYFDRIGNISNPDLDPATAALRLVNSDDNEIANNHFTNVVNTRSGGLVHAIYAAHLSDRNVIARNRFLRSSGDPVRLRDFSNDNRISDNRFIRVGTTAGYTDWYCDHEARDDCTKVGPECPSWGNQFRDNELDGDWECQVLSTWHLFQDDETAGCAPPAPEARRVRTSGNVRTERPCQGE